MTFDEILNEVGEENAGINLLEDEVKKYTSFYPLEVLQRKLPPEGVDVTCKEVRKFKFKHYYFLKTIFLFIKKTKSFT